MQAAPQITPGAAEATPFHTDHLSIHVPSRRHNIPIAHTDPVNAQILAISEDRIQGFVRDPFGEIAEKSGVDVDTVIERIRAMLRAGTIRRVRQTLMATNLAEGALVAWQYPGRQARCGVRLHVPAGSVLAAMSSSAPTDAATPGSKYRLWTTVKVPQGYSIEKHCELLARMTGAEHFRVMPANRIFALGVGHVRRKGMEPGSKSDELAEVKDTTKASCRDLEWRVLTALKREFDAGGDRARSLAARARKRPACRSRRSYESPSR